jgi:hypothetical protein
MRRSAASVHCHYKFIECSKRHFDAEHPRARCTLCSTRVSVATPSVLLAPFEASCDAGMPADARRERRCRCTALLPWLHASAAERRVREARIRSVPRDLFGAPSESESVRSVCHSRPRRSDRCLHAASKRRRRSRRRGGTQTSVPRVDIGTVRAMRAINPLP